MILDTAVLIGIDRDDKRIHALLDLLDRRREPLVLSTLVVAQAWRSGSRQARLARFIKALSIPPIPFDLSAARAVGVLLGVTGTSDVTDGAVVLLAQQYRQPIITGDPVDIARLRPSVRVITI